VEGDGFLGAGASAAGNAWAVGGGFTGLDGTPLTEHWNGTTWKPVPVPVKSGDLRSVSISPAGQAWAVGQMLPPAGPEQTLILRWDGNAWH
jgi:hypothetical protein